MLKNFIKIAFRNLVKHKAFTFINIIGLTIGIACFILIFYWIQDELSYDKYNLGFDRIYRIGSDIKAGEMEDKGISTTPPLGPALINEVPEIESAVRLVSGSNKLVSSNEGEISFLESRIYYADSTVFKVFTIPLIQGDPQDLLTRKKTIVITKAIAAKYFKDQDPIGKILTLDNSREYEVVGVVKDCPSNSHWHFDMLISMVSIQRAYSTDWLSNNLYTYIKIREDADPLFVSEKINQLFLRYADPIFRQVVGMPIAEWETMGNHYHLRMIPLKDVYLFSDESEAVETTGDIRYIYLFASIGFFLLLIACINFTNLTTARSAVRAKEIGMRKVLGSYRNQLIRQLLVESILICTIAMIIALLVIQGVLPQFNQLTGKVLKLNFAGYYSFPIYILLTLVIGLMAGGYSAVSLSSFNTITILKGSLFVGRRKNSFRNILVLFQFSISILVIICTIVAIKQMHFIKNKKLGFNKEQLLIINRVHILDDKLTVFKEEILKHPDITSASGTYCVPGTTTDGSVFNKENTPPEELYFFTRICGDYDYLETMGIELLSGRYFSPDIESDKTAILINETGARSLGGEDPLGKKIIEPDTRKELTIIGVFKDYHTTSLHEEIHPALMHHPDDYWQFHLAVRFGSENVSQTLDFLEKKWQEFAGNQPLDYFFMDSFFDNLHRSEQRTGYFFSLFGILTILIACLGLFGLATFTAEQKTKEIGVRKVMGASVKSIISILLKQFTRWVLLANIIAWPLAYLIMKNWLEKFAYHTDMHIVQFIIAGAVTFSIAVITVSYLALRAATANPVEALKYE